MQRLGLTGALQRTLRTTNIIENLNGSVERYARNVKRWRGGQMIQRWVASALVEAEPRFRRARGYRDLRHLVGALDALAPLSTVIRNGVILDRTSTTTCRGAYEWASSARASLDERARSRRQGRQPRRAGAERSDAP